MEAKLLRTVRSYNVSSDSRSDQWAQNNRQAQYAKKKIKKRKTATSKVVDTVSLFAAITEANMSWCVLLSMPRSKSPSSRLSPTSSFFFDIQDKDRCLFSMMLWIFQHLLVLVASQIFVQIESHFHSYSASSIKICSGFWFEVIFFIKSHFWTGKLSFR